MRLTPLSLTALLLAAALAACSLRLQVVLFNDAGEAVTVTAAGDAIAIKRGRLARFLYPGGDDHWTMRLATAACDYVYQMPRSLAHYPLQPGSGEPLKARLEPDFRIHLLPPDATAIASVAALGSLQQDGFPLRPMSKTCR